MYLNSKKMIKHKYIFIHTYITIYLSPLFADWRSFTMLYNISDLFILSTKSSCAIKSHKKKFSTSKCRFQFLQVVNQQINIPVRINCKGTFMIIPQSSYQIFVVLCMIIFCLKEAVSVPMDMFPLRLNFSKHSVSVTIE